MTFGHMINLLSFRKLDLYGVGYVIVNDFYQVSALFSLACFFNEIRSVMKFNFHFLKYVIIHEKLIENMWHCNIQ